MSVPGIRLPARAAHQYVVVLAGRGELPFSTLHGTPLFVHALTALQRVVDNDVVVLVEVSDERRVTEEALRRGLAVRALSVPEWWAGVRAWDVPTAVLLHDSLCPLASPELLRTVLERGRQQAGTSVAAYRPVTDTVKTVIDDAVCDTIDREGLAAIVAPVLMAAEVLQGDPGATVPPLHDFGLVVGWLRSRGPVALVKAPSLARRVEDESAVNLLECVDDVGRRTTA